MKPFPLIILAGLGLLTASCEKDNYAPPASQLTGRVTFQDNAIGVRRDVQLELWQRGEFFFNKIPVILAQDGTFTATLFDGDYKLTRQRDNGPWQNNTDSIAVQVRGNTVVNVPVQPYFTIGATTIAKSGNAITASALVAKTGTRDIESVTLYLNNSQFVDNFNQVTQVSSSATALGNLSQPLSLSVAVPSSAKSFIYARVGVKAQGVNERIFSPVQKIAL